MTSIRETPAAAGSTGTQRPLPASGNLAADARTLPVGEVVAARVVAGEDGADLLLELAGQRVTVPARLDLPPGSTVSVRVERSGDGLRLTPETTASLPALPGAVAEALRQALPRQTSLASLLPLLARLTGGSVAGQPLAAAAGGAPPAAVRADRPPAATSVGATAAGVVPAPAGATTVDPLAGTRATHATGSIPPAGDPGSPVDPGPSSGPPRSIHFSATEAGRASPAAAPGLAPAGSGSARQLPSLESLLQSAGGGARSTAPEAPALPSAALAAHLIGSAASRPATTSSRLPDGVQHADGATAAASARQAVDTGSTAGEGGEGDGSRLARLAATADTLPSRVTAALFALAERVPAVDDLRDGARLARVVERAGLMLEAHLAARETPSGADIAADLKAALLRVRASVDEGERGREGPAAAGQPAAVEAARAALLQALGDSVDGTLARITVNQIQAATVADSGPVAFSFEIPLRDADGRYQPLQFEFEREAEDAAAQRPPTSTVTLRMQPPGLGPVTAVLRLGGEQISTELWAERPATRALLFHTSDHLAAQLRGAGLEVSTIRLRERPPQRSTPPVVGAHSLIETQV